MINSTIGYIICESNPVTADVQITNEKLNGKPIGTGILQSANEKNRNGRYYAAEELFPQLTCPRTLELLNAGYLRAECGHPLSKDLQRQSTIDDKITCARFLKLWTEGNDVHANFTGTNNSYGEAFNKDLLEGCLPAWSLRALGSIENTSRGAEVKNLRLITWDNVIYPSHPGAYTSGLVSESAGMGAKKSHLQVLVSEAVDYESNKLLSETQDFASKAFATPITNDSVINFIQQESSNLKFLRECFDFVYDGITVNESGSKVLLTTNDGDTIVVNLESYIHNELSKYNDDFQKRLNRFAD